MKWLLPFFLFTAFLNAEFKSIPIPPELEMGLLSIKKNQSNLALSKWGELSFTHEDYIPDLSGQLARLDNSGQQLQSWEWFKTVKVSSSLQHV